MVDAGEPGSLARRRSKSDSVLALGAVLALKPLAAAKSRLDLAPALRRRLALAMFCDTLTAVVAVADEVVVISDEPALQSTLTRCGLDVTVMAEDSPAGLNAALRQGAERLGHFGADRVLACLGDLPALVPSDLDRVVLGASSRASAFLSDTEGVGTTMVIADVDRFDLHFGPGSARAHRDHGLHELDERDLGAPVPTARRDVDTAADLRAATSLGLGRRTAKLIDPSTGELGELISVTVAEPSPAADEQGAGFPVITAAGRRTWLPASAVQDHDRDRPARLRPGQGLHAVVGQGRLLAAWL